MKLSRLFTVSVLAAACMNTTFAATSVDLKHQSTSLLQPYLGTSTLINLKETRRSTDFNKMTHIHLQQTYLNYPIWGSDFIVHIPQGGDTTLASLSSNKVATMNGMLYQGIEKELGANIHKRIPKPLRQ